MASRPMSKTRKFVADGVFYAELNEFLQRELGEDGYAGVEVRSANRKTQIIIRATRTQNVLGEKGRRIRELSGLISLRFNFPKDAVALYAERVENRALSAIAQAESLKFKLLEGGAVRRVAGGVLNYVMMNGAKGVEIIISGKLRAARAKAMKFKSGYMLKSGDASASYVDTAIRHLHLKSGVLGIKVAIQLPYDSTGKAGCSLRQPDLIEIYDPKPAKAQPAVSQQKGFAQHVNKAPQAQTNVAPAATNEQTNFQGYN